MYKTDHMDLHLYKDQPKPYSLPTSIGNLSGGKWKFSCAKVLPKIVTVGRHGNLDIYVLDKAMSSSSHMVPTQSFIIIMS